MEKKKLVIMGNCMAGVRCNEKIIKLVPGSFEITIFGSEPHPNYIEFYYPYRGYFNKGYYHRMFKNKSESNKKGEVPVIKVYHNLPSMLSIMERTIVGM